MKIEETNTRRTEMDCSGTLSSCNNTLSCGDNISSTVIDELKPKVTRNGKTLEVWIKDILYEIVLEPTDILDLMKWLVGQQQHSEELDRHQKSINTSIEKILHEWFNHEMDKHPSHDIMPVERQLRQSTALELRNILLDNLKIDIKSPLNEA